MSENQYKVLISKVKGLRTLVPYNNEFYTKTFDKLIANPSEQYESIYIYTQEHFDQFKKTKSLAGIEGIKTDKIVFDFDSKTDVELALQDTRKVVQRLLNDGFEANEIGVSFSGSKGLHVEIKTEELFSRDQFEAITRSYAGDLETFDTTVSDEQRVFRMPLSLNAKTNKYKVPVAVDDILNPEVTIAEISEYAAAPNFQEDKDIFLSVGSAKNKFKIKKEEKPKTPSVNELISASLDRPDMSRRRKELTEAKYVLEEGFFEQGERNEACMILASTYRYLGYNEQVAYNMLKATLRLRATRLGIDRDYDTAELWHTVIQKVYSKTWKGGMYTENEGLLKKTIQRYGLNKQDVSNALTNINNIGHLYQDFALNIDKNTIKLGIDELDAKFRITTSTLVSLLASPGGGKTHVALSFLNRASKNGIKSLFLSLDMGVPQVYQRLIQKHTGETEEVITRHYKTNNRKKIDEYNQILKEEYENVRFSFKSGLTCEMIREIILNEAEFSGEMPKLVVVDYLECIRSQFSDPTASKAFIATSLKDIANELGICVFLLVQPTKHLADPSTEISSQTAIKGSGVIIEASTIILGLYRPGFSPDHPEDDKFATIVVLKNRMGPLSKTDLSWDGLTGHMRSLSEDERKDLEALKAAIKLEKAEQNEPHTFKRFGQGD